MTHIILSQKGQAGLIMLDRPQALNAMTIEMVTQMSQALLQWEEDESIHHVIITSSSPRAFCAGGDVRQAVGIIAENPKKGAIPYFDAEYGFDCILAGFQKPVIALVDGVVMGGGFGVARLADIMVVSSTIKMAMPETAIGLFPDVGASLFLRRAPMAAALMMGMTGAVIGAGDAMAWQIADYHCQSESFIALQNALCDARTQDDITECLERYHTAPPEPHFALQINDITAIFGTGTPAEIADKAQSHADKGGEASWAAALAHKCPTSIALFWHMMTQERVPNSYIEAICRDYYLACKMTSRADFVEGVRAVLIEKDNAPNWHPATVSEIDHKMLIDLFDFTGMSPLPEVRFTPKTIEVM